MGRHHKRSRTALRIATTAGGMALAATALGGLGGTAFADEPGADALGGTAPVGGTTLADPATGLADPGALPAVTTPAPTGGDGLTVTPLPVTGVEAGSTPGPIGSDSAVVNGTVGPLTITAPVTPNADTVVPQVTGGLNGDGFGGSATVDTTTGTVTGVQGTVGDVTGGVTGDIGAGVINGAQLGVTSGDSSFGLGTQFQGGELTGGSVQFETQF